MSERLKKLTDYPDVSFIEETSFEELKEQMIRDYGKRYQELTGKECLLAPADPYRMILYACAVAIYQGYQYQDRSGKMGLLKYSTGEFLDNLAALKGVTRNEAVPARTKLRFTLSTVLSRDAVIPSGTRVKAADLYFETEVKGVIPAGESTVDVSAVCQQAGMSGNEYLAGDIRTLVDPFPYTLAVENITTSAGGADRETDSELAERVYLAPAGYSTAGPESAYEYWVKTYSPAIRECRVLSEAPGEVDIYITSESEEGDNELAAGLEKFLQNDEIRPLTDHVVVKTPAPVTYEVELTYYIQKTDADIEDTIRTAVETAYQNYISWQKCIGRDITPSRLVYEMMQAGVQSVEVIKPEYTELSGSQIAVVSSRIITYGGLRDG